MNGMVLTRERMDRSSKHFCALPFAIHIAALRVHLKTTIRKRLSETSEQRDSECARHGSIWCLLWESCDNVACIYYSDAGCGVGALCGGWGAKNLKNTLECNNNTVIREGQEPPQKF
jgi:hypothetical protein